MWHFPRRWNLIPFKSAIAVIAGRKHAAFLWKILYLDVFIFLSLSRKAPNDVPFESGSAPKKTCFVIKVPKKSVIISKMPPAATWLMVSASNLSIGSSAHLIHLEWNIKYEKI
jgi:hypothetical protein